MGLRSAIGPMKSHDLEAGGAVRPSQRSRAWRTPWPGSGRPPPAARLRGRGIAYASASSIAAQQCLALAQRARQDLNLRPLAPEAPGQYRQITGFCLQNRGFSRYRPRSIRADLGPFLGPIGPREALRGPINPDTGRLGSRTDRRRRALARLSSATPRQSVSSPRLLRPLSAKGPDLVGAGAGLKSIGVELTRSGGASEVATAGSRSHSVSRICSPSAGSSATGVRWYQVPYTSSPAAGRAAERLGAALAAAAGSPPTAAAATRVR